MRRTSGQFPRGHLLTTTDTEEELDDLSFALGEVHQHLIDFLREGLVHQGAVCVGGVFVDEHVEEAIILTIDEGSVYGDMATRYLEGIGDLVFGDAELLSELLAGGLTLVLLLELLIGPW